LSFDRLKTRLGGAIALLAVAGFLASCQVRPLYSDNAGVAEALGAIAFSEAHHRVEQEVRNHLIFLTSGGKGEPATPEYDVELHVGTGVSPVLLVDSSDTARAGQVTVTGDYVLRRHSDGQILKAGNRSSLALVDFPVQEFAKLRAIRDAENRAARELAELVRADIAAVLAR